MFSLMRSAWLDTFRAGNSITRPHFRPDIEGLRAIAILLVVGFHARIPGFGGGYIGVDVFFVLSGYLITWLLVHEAEEKGTIDLARFYSRRARRLLPALIVVLVCTILLGIVFFAPFEQRLLANTAVATAAYLSNAYFAKVSTDYLGSEADSNPLLHTWSLSVEEQFYIVWPLFVMLLLGVLRWQKRNPGRGWMLPGMCLMTFVSFFLSLFLTDFRQPWAFFLSPTRAWEFSAGALGLLVPTGLWRIVPKRVNQMKGAQEEEASTSLIGNAVMSWLGLAGMLGAAVLYDTTTRFPGTAAILPVFGTVLVLRACASESKTHVARMLQWRPFQEMGRLSYSWYLWHWPVLVFAEAVYDDISIAARLVLIAISLGLAETSYRLVENPIRHNKWLMMRSRRSLVMAACLTFFGVIASFTWRQTAIVWADSSEQINYSHVRSDKPVIYAMNCDMWFYNSDVVECPFGLEAAPAVAVLLGDSHAAQWFSMVKSLTEHGDWRLIVITKAACPIVDASFFYEWVGRTYTECDEWRAKALKRIQELSPDLTIVGTADYYPFSYEEWVSGTTSAFESLSRASDNVILIRDTPRPGFDVPVCLARSAWQPGIFSRDECERFVGKNDTLVFQAQSQVVESLANTHLLDLNDFICPAGTCNTVSDTLTIFWDTDHISDTFAKSLSGEFKEFLTEVLGQPIETFAPGKAARATGEARLHSAQATTQND